MFSSIQLDISAVSKTFIFVLKAVQLDMNPFYAILLWSTEILVLNAAVCVCFFCVCQPDDDRIWLPHVADLHDTYADLN